MPNINQTVKGVPLGFAVATVFGVLAGDAGAAATSEDARRPSWRESRSEADARDEAPTRRIIEIRASEDGTLGTVLFGDGRNESTDASRRSPR